MFVCIELRSSKRSKEEKRRREKLPDNNFFRRAGESVRESEREREREREGRMSEADETRLNSGEEVFLHVYDLSAGLGAALSPFLLGKQVGGIWHTGICVYGKEFYFGNGINIDEAGMTPCGVPQQILSLGKTFVPEELVNDLLLELSATFTPESYSLLHHNCNNFSNEVRKWRENVFNKHRVKLTVY